MCVCVVNAGIDQRADLSPCWTIEIRETSVFDTHSLSVHTHTHPEDRLSSDAFSAFRSTGLQIYISDVNKTKDHRRTISVFVLQNFTFNSLLQKVKSVFLRLTAVNVLPQCFFLLSSKNQNIITVFTFT